LPRLAVVPMVLEARGLDVTPVTIERFEAVGDTRTARILSRIRGRGKPCPLRHEPLHERLCRARRITPALWKTLVDLHFRGAIKPPFNDSARRSAGLSCEFMAGVA
jgi:uncharacterized ferritin-like protein (DUF455 family)